MKLNKISMKLLSVVGAFALIFSLSSCSQEMMEAQYTPDNNNVTFASASAKYSLEGQDLVVKLQRGIADEALSLPLTLTDKKGVYTLNNTTAEFAAGAYTTEVTLSYDVKSLKPVVDYSFTLSFDEKDMAITGSCNFTASCMMPLVYKDWGTISAYKGSFFGYFPAEKLSYKIQLAENTNNYFKVIGMYGSDTDFEFNLTNGTLNITAPSFSYYSYTKDTPLAKFVSAGAHPSYGALSAWILSGRDYMAFAGLTEDGTLQLNSIIQFNTLWTVSAGYFGVYADQFVISEVK